MLNTINSIRALSASLIAGLSITLSGAAHAQELCGSHIRPAEAGLARALRDAGAFDPPGGIAGEGDIFTIPIVIHVVRRNDRSGGLRIDELMQTLEDLETAYLPVGFEFCLTKEIDHINNDGYYFLLDSLEDIDLLRQENATPNAIDIYYVEDLSISGVPLCGISSFSFSPVQGIVMVNACTAADDNPSTTAHEVGHYFNLFHTHETFFGEECPSGWNCEEAGDMICDTPADPGLGRDNVSLSCEYTGMAGLPDPCADFGDAYDPDPTNLMSFSRKNCRDFFSPGQVDLMRSTYLTQRPELWEATCLDLDFEPDPSLQMISRGAGGGLADAESFGVTITGDGQSIYFVSEAENILPDATVRADLFRYDRATDSYEMISINELGEQFLTESTRPKVTPDGRFIVFITNAANAMEPHGPEMSSWQTVLHDIELGTFEMISVNMSGESASTWSNHAVATPDGRYVVFVTRASDIVPGDTNNITDIFIRDRNTQTSERINVSSIGEEADDWTNFYGDSVGVSDDGRFIVYSSKATNLVSNDTNAAQDIFLRDRLENRTVRVSVGMDGEEANDDSVDPHITGDGRFVTFTSRASNLVAKDANGVISDVFLFDRELETTTLIARTPSGDQTDADIIEIDVSPDGRFITFMSEAANYDSSVGEGVVNAFLHDRRMGTTVLASPRGMPALARAVTGAVVSADGSSAAFLSSAANLLPGDIAGFPDVFSYTVPVPVVGDLDGDGDVGTDDLAMLLSQWGPCEKRTCPADLTGDGVVNAADLATLLMNWS